MITLRPSDARGRANLGWLDSRHTFSFSNYYDSRYMGFRSLRVINQDRVLGGHGFPMHPHREMEIISYILEGKLEHEDTMGHRSVIGSGGVQVISGGTGFAHSEYNPSESEPVHFLQIWIEPDEAQHGQPPHYVDRSFPLEERRGKLHLVVSGDGREDSVQIRQDADLYVTVLEPGHEVAQPLRAGRHAWVHVATGNVLLNGQSLGPGDGAAVTEESEIRLVGKDTAEVFVFDLP
ncbi:MAG TPA: pirin family protein [Chloroflexota bacterium]|nr:pirin family protein [Chloroflexota bacterium]